MKRKILKSSLFILSLVTLTGVGVSVNATESSSTSEMKTEEIEDTVTSDSKETIQSTTIFSTEESEDSKDINSAENDTNNSNTDIIDSNNYVNFLYNEGIKRNMLNVELNPLDEWKDLEINFLRPSYDQVIKDKIINSSITYLEWLADNNFGVPINLDPNKYELVIESRGVADNKRNFVNRIQKGDFIVVSSVKDPWAPFIGHAAIATTDNWILDMPGYKSGTNSKKSNNRQLKKGEWFDDYQSAWSRVYRVKTSKDVRNDIADWADWRYWSSTHGLKKNRHVEYSVATVLKDSFDYAYCSKLVWQALYYGSGDLPLVNPRPSAFLVAPYFLPGEINTKYSFNLYGPY